MENLDQLFGATSFGGVGLLTLMGLLLTLRVLLPASSRSKLKMPVVLFAAHLTVVALRAPVPDTSQASKPLALLAVFLLLLALARCLFLLIVESVISSKLGRPLPKIFHDIIEGVTYLAVGFLTLQAAGVEPGSLLTTSALLTAVIGLSLQDTLGNLFSGLSIQAQRPFEVGDWIHIDNENKHIGQVVEINWRATKVLTNDGVEIIIPNGTLAKAAIRNFSKPSVASRRVVELTCPFETPPARIHQVIAAALEGLDDVLDNPPPNIVTTGFGDHGMRYAVRFFISDFQRRDPIDSLVRDRIWYALRRAGIAFVYPVRDVRTQAVMVPDPAAEPRRSSQGIQHRAKVLRGVDVLALLPEEALTKLASQVEARLYAPNEFIIRQGDAGDELFIVERGRVRVIVGRSGGSSAELAKLGMGQFFGEMSLLTGEFRSATVQAIDECQLLIVSRSVFHQYLQESPELAERISKVLIARQEQLDEHIASRAVRTKPSEAEHQTMLLSRIRDFFSLLVGASARRLAPRLALTLWPVVMLHDSPLASHTTLQVGGPAQRLLEATTEEALLDAVAGADAAGEPCVLLGGGSNVLIADEGLAGLVIAVRTRGVRIEHEGEWALVTAAAGEVWDELVSRCTSEGLSGIECLSGIPGLVGATPIQNVGAYGQEVSDTIVCVRAFDRHERRVVELPAEACAFRYRDSAFKSRWPARFVVLSVTFSLRHALPEIPGYAELTRALEGEPAPTSERLREVVIALRRKKSMVLDPVDPDSRSAGSFFTNALLDAGALKALRDRLGDAGEPPIFDAGPEHWKVAAAWLIERAGFNRGFAMGRAGLSSKHALAIINRDGASAAEIVALAQRIQRGVFERFGIWLEPEPVPMGFVGRPLDRPA